MVMDSVVVVLRATRVDVDDSFYVRVTSLDTDMIVRYYGDPAEEMCTTRALLGAMRSMEVANYVRHRGIDAWSLKEYCRMMLRDLERGNVSTLMNEFELLSPKCLGLPLFVCEAGDYPNRKVFLRTMMLGNFDAEFNRIEEMNLTEEEERHRKAVENIRAITLNLHWRSRPYENTVLYNDNIAQSSVDSEYTNLAARLIDQYILTGEPVDERAVAHFNEDYAGIYRNLILSQKLQGV